MKTLTKILVLLSIFFAACSSGVYVNSGYTDDIYYNPNDNDNIQQNVAQTSAKVPESYNKEEFSNDSIVYEEDTNEFNNNLNYYNGLNNYDPYYNNRNNNFGWNFGWNWSFGDPFYSPYYYTPSFSFGFTSPYYYGSYMYGFNNNIYYPYYYGNNFYNPYFYNGYYDYYPYYGNLYWNTHNYGHRNSIATNGSKRNKLNNKTYNIQTSTGTRASQGSVSGSSLRTATSNTTSSTIRTGSASSNSAPVRARNVISTRHSNSHSLTSRSNLKTSGKLNTGSYSKNRTRNVNTFPNYSKPRVRNNNTRQRTNVNNNRGYTPSYSKPYSNKKPAYNTNFNSSKNYSPKPNNNTRSTYRTPVRTGNSNYSPRRSSSSPSQSRSSNSSSPSRSSSSSSSSSNNSSSSSTRHRR